VYLVIITALEQDAAFDRSTSSLGWQECWRGDRTGTAFARRPANSAFLDRERITLRFWILALGAAAVVAARATYRRMTQPPQSRRFPSDQVSNDWLATARIYEDEG